MSYHMRAAENGSFVLPDELVKEIGAGPGDLLSIERDGPALVVRLQEPPSDPVGRLRTAMKGYSVERFIAERRAEMGQ